MKKFGKLVDFGDFCEKSVSTGSYCLFVQPGNVVVGICFGQAKDDGGVPPRKRLLIL